MTDLIRALRAGDSRAFDRVFDENRGPVFRYLVRLTNNRSSAEDLVQETFLRLARHAHRLEPQTKILPWLFTVARHLFLDQRRRTILSWESFQELGLWARATEARSPFEAACANRRQQALERALANLAHKYREPIVLVCIEGLSAKEAADVVGTSTDALRQRVSRGRKLLQKSLAREEGKRKELSHG